ncbi:MAG: hypothetical protein AAB536_00325 [Patescibacteria group bacterium]
MEPIELLKKFKHLGADSDYTRKSKIVILSQGNDKLAGFSLASREIAAGVFRSGWSIAMTAVMLLLAIGSFSILKILSPAKTSVVDIGGLRAEAQAIDAQIELTNVFYNDILGLENKTSTVSAAPPEVKSPKAATVPTQNEINASLGSAETTSTKPTIDSVLDALSR